MRDEVAHPLSGLLIFVFSLISQNLNKQLLIKLAAVYFRPVFCCFHGRRCLTDAWCFYECLCGTRCDAAGAIVLAAGPPKPTGQRVKARRRIIPSITHCLVGSVWSVLGLRGLTPDQNFRVEPKCSELVYLSLLHLDLSEALLTTNPPLDPGRHRWGQ